MRLFLYALRFSHSYGCRWIKEREVNSGDAANWLAIYQQDEPDIAFVVASKKPNKVREH